MEQNGHGHYIFDIRAFNVMGKSAVEITNELHDMFGQPASTLTELSTNNRWLIGDLTLDLESTSFDELSKSQIRLQRRVFFLNKEDALMCKLRFG